MNRRFLRKISTEGTCEVLLADNHVAFVPQLGQEVWLQNRPWRVTEIFPFPSGELLDVFVEPIALPQSPACPLPR